MRRLLVLCLITIFLCGPASADPYMFPDSAGHNEYEVIDEYFPDDADGIRCPPHTEFYVTKDDHLERVEFDFVIYDTEDADFSVPVSFSYNGVIREGCINLQFTNYSSYILYDTSDINVSVTDSNGVICCNTWSIVNAAHASVTFTRDCISVGRYNGLLDVSYDVGLLPADAVMFAFSGDPMRIQRAYITVGDDEYYQNYEEQMGGVFGWLYRRMNYIFPDENMGMFHLFRFLDFGWSFGNTVVCFLMSSFWYCVMFVEVISLAWAVMSRTLAKAIERYIIMHWYALQLPLALFRIFVEIILKVLRLIGSYIPFT